MSKMTKKTGGPYMQQAGRGPMMKTGRGIPTELLSGPAMHEPGHDGPTEINRTNPGQGVKRPTKWYQPRNDSGQNPNAETPLIGPTPLINSDTGDQYTHRFQSASTASTPLGAMGLRPQQQVTPESQKKSRENINNPNPLQQETFARGKFIYNNKDMKPEHLLTNFSGLGYGSDQMRRSARNAGQNINNINQHDLHNTVRTNIDNSGTQFRANSLHSGRVQGALETYERAYDKHIQDSTGISDYNRTKAANDLFASRTQSFNKAIDLSQAQNGWINNGKNKR